MENKVNVNKSTSFVSLLTLAFIVLKLCNVISWSWFWVLSPMIFSVGLLVIFIIVILILTLIIKRI